MTLSTRAMAVWCSFRMRCLALASGARIASRRASHPDMKLSDASHVPKEFFSIAFEFAENFRGQLVVLLAERRDPVREG